MSSILQSPPPFAGDALRPDRDAAEGRQLAALCWRMHLNGPEVLLITSRDTGRWIVPKGWPMEGRSPAEAATREAWEEAGVNGHAKDESIGSFGYSKTRENAEALPCQVEVFSLRVEGLVKDYPERKQRRRKWFRPEKAARKVAEPELRALILAFASAMQAANAGGQDGVPAPSGQDDGDPLSGRHGD